jgi:hypothetical protein
MLPASPVPALLKPLLPPLSFTGSSIPSPQTKRGDTPLDLARRKKKSDIVEFFEEGVSAGRVLNVGTKGFLGKGGVGMCGGGDLCPL